MELELKKECLDTYELGEPQTLTQDETAETIVPDYCPDIARIISAEGMVCLHGGTEQDGVTGTVRVTVLYTPENESGVRALEFAMPFSAQGEGLAGCAHVVVETEIELLESPEDLHPLQAGDPSGRLPEGMPDHLLRRGDGPGAAGGKAVLRADGVFAAAGGGKGPDLFGDHVPVARPGGCGGAAPLPGQRHRDGD